MDLRSRVLSALAWTTAAKFLGQAVSWASTIVVARLLSPDDYGLMAIAMMFISVLTMVSELGLGAALVQQKDGASETTLRQILGLLLLVNLGLCAVFVALAPVLAGFFSDPRLASIIKILSLQFVMNSFSTIPQSLLQRELHLKRKSQVDLIALVISSFTGLALALLGWGVWSLVGASLMNSLARTVGLNCIGHRVLRPVFSFPGVRPYLSFGGQVTTNRVLWSLYSQSDIFVAAKLLGSELVGIYSLAMHLASFPIQKLNGIINEVAFPAFGHIQNDTDNVASHLLKGIRVISVFAFPICWGLSSMAQELVTIVLGAKWQSAAVPLQILALIMPLLMVDNVLHTAVTGLGQVRISLVTLLLACIIMPVAFAIGCRFGLLGLSLAWLIAYPTVFLFLLRLALPIVGIRWSVFFTAMALPALAGIFTYAAVTGAKLFATGDDGSLVRMLVLIVVGVSAYCGMLMSTYRSGCREVWDLVRH